MMLRELERTLPGGIMAIFPVARFGLRTVQVIVDKLLTDG
jgi:hypothetical protein